MHRRITMVVFTVKAVHVMWFILIFSINHGGIGVRGSGIHAFSRRKLSSSSSAYSVVDKASTISVVPKSVDQNNSIVNAERVVREYLASLSSSFSSSPSKPKKGVGKFHLFGWRWHNMSLIRETKRLQKLSVQLLQQQQSQKLQSLETLKSAIDYVVGFNLKGMNRVEKEVMIPFLRNQFSSSSSKSNRVIVVDEKVVEAFNSILDHLETQQLKLETIGNSIESAISKETAFADATIEFVIEQSNNLIQRATLMLEQKNSVLIPAMTQLVTEKEQKSVISKITFTLGIFDSRLHLVGFHEAISDNQQEKKLWNENIPSIARKAIPMWKKSQYDGRTSMLNNI